MTPAELDPVLLEMCGYVKVYESLVAEGMAVSVNLTNGWDRIAVTSEDLGGEGSALGSTKRCLVWAAPGTESSETWQYDLTIMCNHGKINVMVMKSSDTGHSSSLLVRQGTLVALDMPTPMEMLAAQAAHLDDVG